MNDIKGPGKLPKPQPGAPIRMKGVKPVDLPIEQPIQQKIEPEPTVSGQPIRLPPTLPADELRIKRPRKRRMITWILIGLAIVLVLLGGLVAAGYFWYKEALAPYSSSTDRVAITIDDGETADQVATKLEQQDLVKSALALQIYMKLNGKGNVKAGKYLFSPSQQPAEIVQWLNEGRVDTFKVTILPGQTLAEIKDSLIDDYGYSEQAVTAAFAKGYNHALLADKPAGATLEGYIFPETYFVTSDITVEQLIITAFDEFESRIEKQNLKPLLAQRGFSLYQAITLASIVEKEVAGAADQRQVAQVFETRLERGMTLGSDVTYKYGAKLMGVDPSPDLDSPYNTRKYTGLPPGPIANFNLLALEAVAEPAPGDYLFFVSGDDKKNYFAHTFEEHEENIRQHCNVLCKSN